FCKMENSNNNRYELLFMDEEAANVVLPPKVAVAGKKKTDTAQPSTKTEKENKSSVLNKNNAQQKVSSSNAGQKQTGTKHGTPNGVNDARTKQNIRHNPATSNYSSATEYNNDLPQRQIRDRDNKGPLPRFRNNEKPGKREFDRQSGSDKTGIKSVDKRDGAGAHNWGSAKQDIEDIKAGTSAPATDKDDSANENSGGDLANTLEEDDSKQMTLDEWKALKEQRAKPNYNLRKAGEGVDNSEWKKMTVLSKKKEQDTEDEYEYDPSMYPQRVGRLQRIVDIQFNFNDGRKTGFRKANRGPPRVGNRQDAGPNNGFEKLPS
ncbi:hypothetical protein KR222_003671, partial [Zaprionus bogoriensis]